MPLNVGGHFESSQLLGSSRLMPAAHQVYESCIVHPAYEHELKLILALIPKGHGVGLDDLFATAGNPGCPERTRPPVSVLQLGDAAIKHQSIDCKCLQILQNTQCRFMSQTKLIPSRMQHKP